MNELTKFKQEIFAAALREDTDLNYKYIEFAKYECKNVDDEDVCLDKFAENHIETHGGQDKAIQCYKDIDRIMSLTIIDIYRGLGITTIDDFNDRDPGIHWSWDFESASKFKDGQMWQPRSTDMVVHAKINRKDIDHEETWAKNVNFMCAEKEIVVRKKVFVDSFFRRINNWTEEKR